jgi:hypothetical protein
VSATPSTISAAPNRTGTRAIAANQKYNRVARIAAVRVRSANNPRCCPLGAILTHTPDRPTHERLDIRVEVLVAMRLVLSGAGVGNALSESSRQYRQTIDPDRIGPIAIVR